ncbi:hypothetical protein A2856_00220 [Candidatus Uhrbacteria bacterium RIFCSPHIGHO2_01_FULL_63_20]|uniref:DUF2268 domain-containing protein n=1 Tax=Candidatus Uhrbacteria bacterium RIFCSPHIGHO2_01_FULL_63_20 TaxID=1802385 RepID=A0A1F7TMS5_9BACT|nr:MAG: hypothetical protein A2856_00220 [Candidatus Uhrbacteria bacterium RIFCSPHIGHO2_01_FULL_63_20]
MADMNDQELFPKLQAHLSACWGFDAQPASPSDAGFDFVQRSIVKARLALERIGLPADEVRTMIIRGNGSANGHACLIDGKPVAWFAAEGYPTQERADAFVPHEIIHAIHYPLCHDYAFDTKEKKNELGRQLVTEGIATVLTAQAMDIPLEQALWADVQTIEATKRWMETISSDLPKRASSIRERWNEDAGEWFLANDPSDPFRYRAGYAIGAMTIDRVMRGQKLSPNALLSLPRTTLDELVRNALG